jgi:hypothetical protein
MSVMKECKKNGYLVYCLTEQALVSNFEQIQFLFVKPRMFQRIQNFAKKIVLGRTVVMKLNQFLNKVLLFICIPIWPLLSPLFAYRLYKKALIFCKRENIDCIVPIYTQIDTLIAAHFIKKKIPTIKYVPYFLDSLSGGYGPRVFSKEWTIQKGLKWEKMLLENADKIVAMESSRKHHEFYSRTASFFSRFIFLDLPLFKWNSVINEKKTDCITMAYVGTLPKGIRSPRFIVDVLSKIKSKKIKFVFVGENHNSILNAVASMDKRFFVIGRISHKEANEWICRSDVLINIGNTNRNMTPCKIFEYMSTGKKILSTFPIENEPSVFYLKKYSNALLLDERRRDYANLADEVVSFINKKTRSVDSCTLKKLFYENTPQAFVAELNKI